MGDSSDPDPPPKTTHTAHFTLSHDKRSFELYAAQRDNRPELLSKIKCVISVVLQLSVPISNNEAQQR